MCTYVIMPKKITVSRIEANVIHENCSRFLELTKRRFIVPTGNRYGMLYIVFFSPPNILWQVAVRVRPSFIREIFGLLIIFSGINKIFLSHNFSFDILYIIHSVALRDDFRDSEFLNIVKNISIDITFFFIVVHTAVCLLAWNTLFNIGSCVRVVLYWQKYSLAI